MAEKSVDLDVASLENNDKHSNATTSDPVQGVRYSKHGLPLVPQPSTDPLDPLNWSQWRKEIVLIQVSLLSGLSLLGASVIAPSFQPLSIFLHQNIVNTAYVVSIFIGFLGAATFLWNPLSNIYGRRPLYIIGTILSIVTAAASGASRSYGEMLAFRALNGFFGGVPLGLGSPVVCDMFFEHERGFHMGIYTVLLITGGHIAPFIGGFIEKDLTWQWCFYVPSIIGAALLILFIFTVPETLYLRTPESHQRPVRPWPRNMLIRGRVNPNRRLQVVDFLRPLQMLRYPSVTFPVIHYGVSFGYSSIIFILSSASIFAGAYKFQPYQTGLLLGLPLTIGSILGESTAGALSDFISNKRTLSRGGVRKPEDRLIALIPALFLSPLGTIIEGVCIQHKTHWVGPGFGIAIASYGLQVSSTIVYTYTAECYKPQATEIGTLLNFSRQMFGFCVGFYAVPLGNMIGFQNAWIIFAMLNVFFSLPMVVLMFKGEQWRVTLGPVMFDRDL